MSNKQYRTCSRHSSRTSRPSSTSWRPLSDPRPSMVLRFGDPVYYSQIGPQWRESMFLQHIICCKCTVPQPIIQAEFGIHPFHLAVLFLLVSFLHSQGLQRLYNQEGEIPLSCTLLLRGHRFRYPLKSCSWLVHRGISAASVNDHLPSAPSLI